MDCAKGFTMAHIEQFDFDHAQQALRRTPAILDAWLRACPDDVVRENEGPETWSAFDVVGHLIHGEKTDWLPRVKVILDEGPGGEFQPFDRFAQFEASAGKTIGQLLDEFAALRAVSLEALAGLHLQPADFDRTARHPALGVVTLRQLLATWVVHDHDHVMQIARVLASRWAPHVGPWRAYLRIVSGQPG